MSILIQSGDQYFEISAETLAEHAISADEYESRSREGTVGEESPAWDEYADSVQIGCGCCMSKASYGASC